MSALTVTIDGKVYALPGLDVTDFIEQGKQEGYTLGEQAGREECAAKHYVEQVKGSGSASLTFDCPFEPDSIIIMAFGELTVAKNNSVVFYVFDRTDGRGKFCGLGALYNSSTTNISQAGYSSTTGGNRYSRNEAAGTVTISNVATNDGTGTFDSNLTYTVICEKHT